MHCKLSRRLLAVSVAALLAGTAMAPASAADPAPAAGASSQKFGLVGVAVVAGAIANIYEAFTTWSNQRAQATALVPTGLPMQPVMFSPNPGYVAAPPAAAPAYQMQTPQAAWVPAPSMPFPAAPAGQPLPVSPNFSTTPIILGQPDVPFNAGGNFDPNKDWNGSYNYQGVQVAAVILNANNQAVEIRPLNAPFRSGERFKLRLLSSFDTLASIDAYRSGTPAAGYGQPQPAWVGQLYPARSDQIVRVRAGEAALLPLGANEYFTFDNRPGLDKLVLNFRHAQAQGGQVNNQPVYRQDGPQGSSYVQLMAPGTFPAFSQTVALQHNP